MVKNNKINTERRNYMFEKINEITELKDYIVFDLETRGLEYIPNQITQLGMIKIIDGKLVDKLSTYVKCNGPIPPKIQKLTGITDDLCEFAPTMQELKPQILEFAGDLPIMGQNSDKFDIPMLAANDIIFANDLHYDTYLMAKNGVEGVHLGGDRYNLDALVERYNVNIERPEHDATLDATLTYHVFLGMQKAFAERRNLILSKIEGRV